ncbi:DNA polymerase III subunit delta [Marinicellulosiphila megalodicopiae]|uniref:DNA polymerase III subunit delta n=1 Tax=Marinicellulosiphila megalodicopiae TaxID=2724896 RepID=UPI003BAE778D
MKVNANQLPAKLKQSLELFYWVSGDEPLLVDECCDQIRQAARAKGVVEREVFEVDGRFKWAQVIEANQAVSLFGDRKMIELRLTGKLNAEGQKALAAYFEQPNPDNVLLLVCPKIESASTKTKWFKTLEKHAQWIALWPIAIAQLPAWINDRIKSKGLTIDQEALQLLVEKVDGNLLAGKQEIEKLVLIAQGSNIDLQTVINSVADSARYNVFDLSESMLKNDVKRSFKILQGLQGEAVEPTIILWALSKDIRVLSMLKYAANHGQPTNQVFTSQRIWDAQQVLYNRALGQKSLNDLQQMVRFCGLIDRTIKGQFKGNVWQQFEALIFAWFNVQGMIMLNQALDVS